ncbi:DUF4439 domain-containing protein [Brachybacterium tyrofermentans]|uniref:DUF4439 domain-containing protein n=1 Tax=Brachybacterium tyrofermentans TaxID=47848 RepID=UPI003FCF2D68
MLLPTDSPSAARLPSRRRVLASGALGVLALAGLPGCGRIAVGGPEAYTPPPPGIDDLYRADLLDVLDRAIAGAEALAGSDGDSDSDDGAPDPSGATADGSTGPALPGVLSMLVAALPAQRAALLTGAEAERAATAGSDPASTSPPPPSDAPTDAAGLLAVLVELRLLAADAARQVSGSLARPVVAIAAHSAWSARRLHVAAAAGEVAPLRPAEEIVPSREVPTTDPATVGAEVDYHSTIERAQQEEWYVGYLYEVLAARTTDAGEREAGLAHSDRHRARAESLAAIAEEDGAPVVPRQAVYALPGGTLDDRMAAELPRMLAEGLLVDHAALVGAAPFDRRPLSILATMQEGELLATRTEEMPPLPGLEIEDPAPSDGG